MNRHHLCEKALNRLGSYALVEGSQAERACNEWYEYSMRQANAMYNWSFAKRREVLVPSAPGMFNLPFDCLKVVRMGLDAGGEVRSPEIVGEQLLTHGQTPSRVRLTYISDMVAAGGSLPERAPHYIEACILLLASNMAMQMTGRFDVASGLREQADATFRKAITEDRQQDYSRAQHPLDRLLRENVFRD